MNAFEYLRIALRFREYPLYVIYLRGRKTLDVGCGGGEFLARDPKNFTGIDINEDLLAQCRAKGLDVLSMSALELRFPNASFDAVHAAQMIEHFTPTDAVKFLEEAARVLRPGGVIFLTTPGAKNVWHTFSHIRPYPPQAFRKLLSSGTEAYIRERKLPLVLEVGLGTRRYFSNRILALISHAFDVLLPPSDPIGWTIVLRKQ